ncbi:M3 family metallopeptidase [Thermodesulfobacteriota bacterium]
MNKFRLVLSLAVLVLIAACSSDMDTSSTQSAVVGDNPFYSPSSLPLEFPPFDRIETAHYLPAFEKGMADQLAEVEGIANKSEASTFNNTIVALEISGALLTRVSNVFYAMSAAHTNDDIKAVETEVAPKLSAHQDSILLNKKLYDRVKALYDNRDDLGLDAESKRLVEETHKSFVRAGAALNDQQKKRMKEINSELAELSTQFSQNVLNEVNDLAVVVDSREELAGLTEAQIEAAADEAESRDLPGKFVLPLLNTSGQPVMASLENRALRQRIHETSLSRGHRGGEFDNLEILSRTAKLRAERAKLLGYESHAAYILENQTAKTVEAVNQRLAELTPPAVANAKREAADMQAMIDDEGGNFKLASWDWDFYTEKVRQKRFNFDESELRPYLEVNSVMKKGLFYAANQLFGLTFKERSDLPVYQEDVRVFEVFDADGSTLSFLIMDLYARPSKRGGAWMNDYVAQSNLLNRKAVVGNHLNITKPPEDEPTLMTFDEVTTMFHEFGHGLHGILSNVTYESFSGTNVPRDYVEFPSQVNEMWADWPEVLKNYAVHYKTGEHMPQELLDKVLASSKFNQGFRTTEYLEASLTDMALHQLKPDEVPSADELMRFEEDALTKAGAKLDVVPPRYHLPYFSHIMGGYSAGYYSYIWAEVLDADAVEWFKENGGMTRENGKHIRDTVLSRGFSVEPMQQFTNFRGRNPDVKPLLERRGLN